MAQPPAPCAPDRFFADLGPTCDAELGGKARSLVQLAAAGLRVPAGFVVTDALFRALIAAAPAGVTPTLVPAVALAPWPAGFAAALHHRLTALGTDRVSVRSSFASEDRPGRIAAGIFESRIGVAHADVPAALRQVLASALSPAAAAYAQAHGETPAAPPVAVLIHAHVAADAQGGAAAWRQDRDDRGEPAVPRTLIDVHAGTLAPAARATITAAATALLARHGPIELEWAARGDDVTFLQLRPFSPAPTPAPWPGWRDLGPGESPAAWSWDAAHNPLPLSAAHAGLIAIVDQRCQIGIRQRVLGGYLFWSDAPAPAAIATDIDLPATITRLDAEIAAGRAPLGAAPALEPALEFFLSHYQVLLGALPPVMRRARADLARFVGEHLPDHADLVPTLLAEVESQEKIRRRCAADLARASGAAARARALQAYLAVFGDEAPAWDLASPTHRERPDQLRQASAEVAPPRPPAAPAAWSTTADQLAAQLPANLRLRWHGCVTRARQAVAAGEDDDWLYARIQAPVRQALLAIGQQLADAGALDVAADVFDLDLACARAIAAGEVFAPDVLRAQAAAGRAAQAAARLVPPPLPGAAPAHAPPSPNSVRGHGCGGHAVGKVVLRHGPAGAHPPADAILVATSLLPTELPLLQVAALVTETGGPLGHVATQARERGLPAVVGAAGALAIFREGDLAVVDGTTGLVVRAHGTSDRTRDPTSDGT